MTLDKRKKDQVLMFIGEGPSLPKFVIEEGDEVTLYHEGNLVMAKITSISENQEMTGIITRSAYDPDLHSDLTVGKEIRFSEENIFGVSKQNLQN